MRKAEPQCVRLGAHVQLTRLTEVPAVCDAAADPEAFVTGLKAFRERLNAAAWSDADITRAKRAGRP